MKKFLNKDWERPAFSFRRWPPYLISVCALSVAGSLTVLAVATARPEAPTSPRIDLLQLQVYAKESIHAERSDYQGSTAAGGTIDLTDFQINGDLSSGQEVIFQNGQLTGYVDASKALLSHVFTSGRRPVDKAGFEIASLKLDLLGARMSALPANQSFEVKRAASTRPEFRAIAVNGVTVVDMVGDQAFLGNDGARIVLVGDRQASILVRIHGRSVHLDHVAFAVEGGLEPSRIVFFFPEARELEISSSGGAHDSQGHMWDIPGSVIAPEAALRFAASTVDGQVFARSIDAMDGLPSGQVNRIPISNGNAAVSNHFVASSLLSAIDTGAVSNIDKGNENKVVSMSSVMQSGCKLVCRRD